MIELLEQMMPPVEQMLEDPTIGVAAATAGSIAVYAFISEGGQIKADYEISELDQEEISERKRELSSEIETESFAKETYNRLRHPWIDGKLSAYQEADKNHSTYNPPVENPEYFNQIYTDEEIEKQD